MEKRMDQDSWICGNLAAYRQSDGQWIVEGSMDDEPLWRLSGGITLYTASEEDHGAVRRAATARYCEVTQRENELQCDCSLVTDTGSSIAVHDRYQRVDNSTIIERTLQVISTGKGDAGFYIDTAFTLMGWGAPGDHPWFAPGCWYGQGKPFFRLSNRNEAGGATDWFSAPGLLAYDERSGRSLMLLEDSPGRQRTVAGDCEESIPGVLISEQFYLSGMGVRQMDADCSGLYYAYPGYTHVDQLGELYRLLPMREGLRRTIRLELHAGRSVSFHQAMRQAWRGMWQRWATPQYFASPLKVRRALLDYVDASYTVEHTEQGDIHKYMKDAQYNEASSGFLFRNIDLAQLMLEDCVETPNKGRQARALAVIASQIYEKRLYGRGKWIDLRASMEGLHSLMKCRACARELGCERQEWLTFAAQEAEEVLETEEYYSIPLMLALYDALHDQRYLQAGVKKGNWSWENRFSKMLFMGGITDCGPGTLDRESALLALEGYLDLFEVTNDGCWLERASFCADYLETMQVITDIDMEPYGVTGLECAERHEHYAVMASSGNGLSPVGLSHIVAGGSCGDIYNVYSAPDYVRLYRYTGDTHYLDFARMLQYSTLQYVNMGNKVGGMDDPLHHTGKGFINEFIAIGICSGYVTGRGWAHGDNIGWCPYVLLSSMHRMKQLTGSYALPFTIPENA